MKAWGKLKSSIILIQNEDFWKVHFCNCEIFQKSKNSVLLIRGECVDIQTLRAIRLSFLFYATHYFSLLQIRYLIAAVWISNFLSNQQYPAMIVVKGIVSTDDAFRIEWIGGRWPYWRNTRGTDEWVGVGMNGRFGRLGTVTGRHRHRCGGSVLQDMLL